MLKAENVRYQKKKREWNISKHYYITIRCDGSKLSKKNNIVTKFEITVVFLLPVGSLLARKADYKLVSPRSFAPFHCARITMGKQ